MADVEFLRGETVTLRPAEKTDADFFREHRNDPEMRRLMRNPVPKNTRVLEREYEEYAERDDSAAFIAMCEAERASGNDGESRDGEATESRVRAGFIGLWGIDEADGTGWLGAWVAPEFHGEGVATEAAALVVDYAFEERRLNKVAAGVYAPNDPSNRVMEKLGFEREAVLRGEKFIDGERVDSYRYGMLREEWEGR